MTWRPVVTLTALVAMALVLGVMLFQEHVPMPNRGPDVVSVEEPLRHLQYAENNRRQNFVAMGMDDALADETATRAEKILANRDTRARLEKLLRESEVAVGEALCPSNEVVPQPYAALRFLVREEHERREVTDPSVLLGFEEQPWYAIAPVQAIYADLELTPGRRADATVMGVAALLLSRERDALEHQSPWAVGLLGRWGFGALRADQPAIEGLVVQYFSFMHVLTELANTADGICS